MTTRRMNEMWRRISLALALCVLLFHSCQGQDDTTPLPSDTQQTGSTDAPDAQQNAHNPTDSPASDNSDASAPTSVPLDTDATGLPGQINEATVKVSVDSDLGNSGSISVVSEADVFKLLDAVDTVTIKTSNTVATAQPQIITVKCVDKDVVMHRDAVKFELESPSTCLETKGTINAKMGHLCDKQTCTFEIFQEDNSKNVILTGTGVEGDVIGMKERIENIKAELGVFEASTEHAKNSPAVLVSLLVTGIVAAAAMIGIYVWKNNRRTNGKSMKLAEESVMADEVNQGNTLVSVAPLNPPESQEKPSQNGESPEAVKTQTPPAATNGHSTTKTADTEL